MEQGAWIALRGAVVALLRFDRKRLKQYLDGAPTVRELIGLACLYCRSLIGEVRPLA